MDRSFTPNHPPAPRTADDAFTRVAGGLTRWALGWGLLSLHATVFTVSMISMLLWNIYDAPDDIWVDEVFRRWGVVLAFHAIAVAAGQTAWRLVKAEQQALIAEPPQWTSAPTRPAGAIAARSIQSQPIQPLPIPASVEPGGWAPFPEQPVVPVARSGSRRYLMILRRADAAFGRGLAASATWTGNSSRRAATSISAGISGLLQRGKHAEAAAPADPVFNWPQSPVLHRPEDEEFISRFAGNGANGSNGGFGTRPHAGVDIVLDVNGVSSDANRRAEGLPIKEPGQSWVQAATYNWQMPHDPLPGATHAAQNGHAASPPEFSPGSGTTPPAAND